MLAEAGELVDNDKGTFLVLQNGIVQRHAADQRDPAMVVFDRYAFDLSQFAGGPQAVQYSIRERYLWQLILPDPKDTFYIEQPGQFRAELHDRLIGAALSDRLRGDRLRLSGRAAHHPAKPHAVDGRRHRRGGAAAPDRLCLHRVRRHACRGCCRCNMSRWPSRSPAASGSIRRGLILEPPAFITDWLAALTERLSATLRHVSEPSMPILAGTLARYFGLRFLSAVRWCSSAFSC